jgi:hypothetical protein
MANDTHSPAYNLTTPYRPVAIYYEASDIVEYMREDVPAVYHRVDGFLTLIFDMTDRNKLIGFSMKGFKNYYLKNLRNVGVFVSLVGALEFRITTLGHEMFGNHIKEEYERARKLAFESNAKIEGLASLAA